MRNFTRLWRSCAAGAPLLAAVSGCGDTVELRRPMDVTAELSEDISTVVNVSWRTDAPAIGYVEYGTTEEMELNTPLEGEPAEEHSVSLLGLSADTEYFYRVVTWDAAGAAASEVASIETGPLPVSMPNLDVAGEGQEEFVVVPILGQNPAITILNQDGEVVWYHLDDRDLEFFRARLSVDGKSVLYNAAEVANPSEDSEIVRVALDGSDTETIPVPLLEHDFVEHKDGTIGAVAAEYRDFEGEPLRGNQIVEVDPDGELTQVWTTWDCFDPADQAGEIDDLGWGYANALDYDEGQGAYYIGLRNFSSIVKVDRESGDCEWVLGLTGSTFDFADGSARFLHQHQLYLDNDTILVFDNDGDTENQSRVIEYELDFDNNVATEVYSYVSDPPVYSFVLGEPIRLNNGDTFIDWAVAGQLERVNEDWESLWKVTAPAGVAFGFVTLAKTLY